MEQGDRLKAPGRLQARADLAGVEVTLPALWPRELWGCLGFGAALLAGLLAFLRGLDGGAYGQALLEEMLVTAVLVTAPPLLTVLYGCAAREPGTDVRAAKAVGAVGTLAFAGFCSGLTGGELFLGFF